MKHLLGIILLLGLQLTLSAQITYEPGYFIDTLGNKTQCLILYKEWKNNPVKFSYKLAEQGAEQVGSIEEVKEFGVYQLCKYIRSSVSIDGSSNIITSISSQKEPEWYDKTVFLRILLEGKASLYYYEDNDHQRYFYSIDSSAIRQLISKQYRIEGPDKIESNWNNQFRQQLWMEMRCPDTHMDDMESLGYNEKALIAYFKSYNACSGSSMLVYNPRKKFSLFHLWITPGLNYSSLNIYYPGIQSSILNFDPGFFPRIGFETEFVFPFNRNKWSLLAEPNYQYFKSEASNAVNKIKYRFIEFPVGLRYNVFLNKNLKIFANAFFILPAAIDFDSELNKKTYGSIKIGTLNNNLAFGIGCAYKRWMFETRYYKAIDILDNYSFWISEYKKTTFSIGYRLL